MKYLTLTQLNESTVSHNPNIRKKVMLSPGELGPITQFAQAVFPPGEIAHAHSHDDMAEVFLVTAGEGMMRIDDEEYSMSPGSCIVVEANERHELANTGIEDLVVIYFGVGL